MEGYFIAMSGGVDSSAAASLILEQHPGEPICASTLMMGNSLDAQNAADAASVAGRLGIAHEAIPCEAEFRRAVLDYFAETYRAGMTPNPCVICNREIKFGLLAREADRRGLFYIVTGHYARTDTLNGRAVIRRAVDGAKDQSYVLAMLSQSQVRRACFPLGMYTKPEVRELAASRGFITAGKHDSQDICFVPDGDYVSFLRREYGIEPIAGEYVDKSGAYLGQHKGHICYTIGQRKGLGISMGRHVFVLEKDALSNRVVLGDEADLMRRRVEVSGFNAQAVEDIRALDGGQFEAKLRYTRKESAAVVHVTGPGSMVLEFASPQRAPSPGQFAVLYSGDILIGGGIIVG